MKKLNKIAIVFVVIMVFICLFSIKVYGLSGSVNITSSSSEIKPGDTVNVTIKINNLDAGINAVSGTINYDKDALELQEHSKVGKWTLSYSNSGRFIASKSSLTNSEVDVLKLEFKAKNITKVATVVVNDCKISDGETETVIGTGSVNVTVKKPNDPEPAPPTPLDPPSSTNPTQPDPPSTTNPTQPNPPSTTNPTQPSQPSTTNPTQPNPPSTTGSSQATPPSTTNPSQSNPPATTGSAQANPPSTTNPSQSNSPAIIGPVQANPSEITNPTQSTTLASTGSNSSVSEKSNKSGAQSDGSKEQNPSVQVYIKQSEENNSNNQDENKNEMNIAENNNVNNTIKDTTNNIVRNTTNNIKSKNDNSVSKQNLPNTGKGISIIIFVVIGAVLLVMVARVVKKSKKK